MYSTLLLVMVTFGQVTVDDYGTGCQKAKKENRPLVVFVGCKAHPVDGHLVCQIQALEGYEAPCKVVCAPREGKLYFQGYLEQEALHEVNARRAQKGLRPFIFDPGLTQAALAAAKHRAQHRITGHVGGPGGDFAFLPPGIDAKAAGCAAWEPSWGWGSCCSDDNFTYAGAAWAWGSDGRRYMHLFVR